MISNLCELHYTIGYTLFISLLCTVSMLKYSNPTFSNYLSVVVISKYIN